MGPDSTKNVPLLVAATADGPPGFEVVPTAIGTSLGDAGSSGFTSATDWSVWFAIASSDPSTDMSMAANEILPFSVGGTIGARKLRLLSENTSTWPLVSR